MRRLGRSFYDRDAVTVARDLLGRTLVRVSAGKRMSGRIVEVEAYAGRTDPGSHAFRGRTERNGVMFGPPGFVYVYRIYGLHTCMNLVCDREDVAAAVLVRALEPIDGIDVMETNRGIARLVDLCNGPGKVCQALGITLESNGADLEGDDVCVEHEEMVTVATHVSTRIGLSRGVELPWRFLLSNNRFVSNGRPSRAASR